MKFIPVASAKGLDIDKPVFTLNDKGEYGLGRLVEERKTASGIVRTFEVATFDGREDIKLFVTNITHVAIIKNKEP